MKWLVKGSDAAGREIEQLFSADTQQQAEAFAQISGIAVASVEQVAERGRVELPDDPLAALATAAQEKRPPSVPYAKNRRSSNALKRYMERVGTTSFVCQAALLCVTVIFLGLAFVSFSSTLLSASQNPFPQGHPYHDAEAAGNVVGMLGSWVCLFVGWLIFALPLTIAAMVTKREF